MNTEQTSKNIYVNILRILGNYASPYTLYTLGNISYGKKVYDMAGRMKSLVCMCAGE